MIIKQSVNGIIVYIDDEYDEVGVYLWVYKNGIQLADHLQDDVAMAMQQAEIEYNCLSGNWDECRRPFDV